MLLSGFDTVFPIWKEFVVDANENTFSKFSKSFVKGYYNKPSFRMSNKSSTIPDPIIDIIIQTRIPEFTNRDISLIRFGHRLSMSAENILGLILEEYIHVNVVDHGWACCWGNCIPAVDFCSTSKTLLQVKNRSNTENSSSNKIRENTDILKWYRINANNAQTNWDELNSIIGIDTLSESSSIDFTKGLINYNPNALHVDEDEYSKLFLD